MIVGLLLRHYKNYGNIRFIPLMNNNNHMFAVYIGNNGVGKSAILEALDVVMNGHRVWNVTQGQKKTEAFICPMFLILKSKIPSSKRRDIEMVSEFFWEQTFSAPSGQATKEFVEYKNTLIQYRKSHYLVLIGVSNDKPGAFFSSSFDGEIKKLFGGNPEEQSKRANALKDLVFDLYSYLYVPVEESPIELLKLQNDTMQKLLNKDVQQEIERILNSKKQEKSSIVNQINKNLDAFIKDVNNVISQIDPDYSFAPEGGSKQKLTAKDIRAKIIEAYFPLRALRKGSRRVDLLSS